jgi:hypothetical protein
MDESTEITGERFKRFLANFASPHMLADVSGPSQ